MRDPVDRGYLADPQLVRLPDGWAMYGTADPASGDRGVATLRSPDLLTWERVDAVLEAPDPALGDALWAPEVIEADGRWWMYYSVGRGIAGHQLRVAVADAPFGPFVDTGVDLTPDEPFAIDPHPFVDVDGTRYLFFARDGLDGPRPGTRLAALVLSSMTTVATGAVTVLEPYADWQIYQRSRAMYGREFDWHTIEGPSVLRRRDGYLLFFSGGSWENEGYGVAVARAPHPLGPWVPIGGPGPTVLDSRRTGLTGPGHCSVLAAPGDRTLISFHAWNPQRTRRQPYLDELEWTDGTPRVPSAPAAPHVA